MSQIKDYLEVIEGVINKGHYKDNWASLSEVEIPKWYKRAKFGIFVHWGIYSVPAFGDEWYPRRMYLMETPEYAHHIDTYGPHKDFGYKDFIPMFKGEEFDPSNWAALFKTSGAQYVTPVAEHHDGFQMYDSALSHWNAAQMGPCRDVIGELKGAVEAEGMVFCASSHRAENYWFFSGARDFDSGIDGIEFQEPYGYAHKLFDQSDQDGFTHIITSEGPSTEHLENWLVRTCELVDKYQPQLVYFDWWIMNLAFKPYLKKFAAYYYNRAIEWDKEVLINYKHDAFANGTAVYDIERGQASGIRENTWQSDTAIGLKSWGYTEDNDYKAPESIVTDLMDVVSKNGCMMLNVGPKADGTIGDKDRLILEGIGQWLSTNGEAVYDTHCWHIFGEGPTKAREGYFTDGQRLTYTKEDMRFTYKAPFIYVTIMSWPADSKICIKALKDQSHLFSSLVADIEVLGYDYEVNFDRNQDGLDVEVCGEIETTYPVCLKITID